MKKLLLSTSLISLLSLSSPALFAGSQYNNSFEDSARVTHVEPIYTSVRVSTPRRECTQRSYRQRAPQQQSYTSTIAGGIIGGLLGHQVGGGSGKKIMTAAGVLLGGSIGRDVNHNSNSHAQYETRESCQMTERYHQEERLDGYLVTYQYKGKSYTTEMDENPGKRIPIEVSIRPIGTYY